MINWFIFDVLLSHKIYILSVNYKVPPHIDVKIKIKKSLKMTMFDLLIIYCDGI